MRQSFLFGVFSGVLFVPIVIAGPDERRKNKPKPLASSVTKTNNLLESSSQFGDGARARVKISRLLDGEFTCSLVVRSCEDAKEGALELDATLHVNRGSAARYMTPDERDALSRANKKLAKLRGDRGERIRKFKSEHTHRKKCPHINRENPDRYHERIGGVDYCKGRVLLGTNEFENRLARIEADFADRIRSAQTRLNDVSRVVNERIKREKEAHDVVEVTMAIPKKLAKRVDRVRLLRKKKSMWRCRVVDFFGDQESNEIGGKIRIVRLDLRATAVHKSNRK